MLDFNVHLPCHLGKTTDERLADETAMEVADLSRCYGIHKAELHTKMHGANFMLFNQDYPFGEHSIVEWIAEVRGDWNIAAFTQLLDFRRSGLDSALDWLSASGINGVKFHSYLQRISESEFPTVLAAAKSAAESA